MKKLLTTATLLITLISAQAKDKKIKSLDDFRKNVNQTQAQDRARAKTTNTFWRLSAYAIYSENGNGLEIEDSSYYIYSNARGSEFDFKDMEYYDYGVDPEFNFINADTCYKYYDQGAGFELNEKYTSGYDNANARQWFLEQYGTSLEDSSIEYAIYDGNGNLIVETYADWNKGTKSWDTAYAYFYTYNSQGLVIEDSAYDYDFGEPDTKSDYTYDSNGNLIATAFYEWDNGSWSGVYRATLAYDGNGRATTTVTESYENGAWINAAKDSLAYTGTANNHTYRLFQMWDTSGKKWVNSFRGVRTLNSNNVPATETSAVYDTMAKQWMVLGEVDYTYNSNGDIESATTYPIVNGTKLNTPVSVGYYYYRHYFNVDVKDIAADKEMLVFPNPASTYINVKVPAQATISLVSMTGQTVKQQAVQAAGQATISLSGVPPGNYVLNIQAAAGQNHKQLVTIQ